MDKYTSEAEKTKPENKDKIVLSNDAFAVTEYIEELIKKIEKIRRSFLK